MSQKTMLSAIQPYSVPTLGNYLGAIRNWAKAQDEFKCYFFGVDLHAITFPQDPQQLHEDTYSSFAYYLACGLDPERSTLFLQSHVHEHAELAWVLTCFTYMGELSRMTQFKDKSKKQGQNIGVGLFCYPVLMAADILLYRPDFIPVGDDQKQHVEIARDIAERFNKRYQREIFAIPKPYFGQSGSRIMDLREPENKMSKSANNPNGTVFLNDSNDRLAKKFRSAVTDSGSEVNALAVSPGLQNLVEIFASLSDTSIESVLSNYAGKTYGVLKQDLADLVVAKIEPIRERAAVLMQDRTAIDRIFASGAENAQAIAKKTLAQVYETVGFVPKR